MSQLAADGTILFFPASLKGHISMGEFVIDISNTDLRHDTGELIRPLGGQIVDRVTTVGCPPDGDPVRIRPAFLDEVIDSGDIILKGPEAALQVVGRLPGWSIARGIECRRPPREV